MTFREYRDGDAEAIAELWNVATEGVYVRRPITGELYQQLVVSKEIFDPQGLILAWHGEALVGLVHCGFGPAREGDRLDYAWGVISALIVHPVHRRRGLGRRLAGKGIRYLRGKGSQEIRAMAMWPLTPFYVGLYGGSEISGLSHRLDGAHRFFAHLGFERELDNVIMRRDLAQEIAVGDDRLRQLAQEVRVGLALEDAETFGPWQPRYVQPPFQKAVTPFLWHRQTVWWSHQVHHPITTWPVYLIRNGKVIATCSYWDMEGFEPRPGERIAGVGGVGTPEELRRGGLGTLAMLAACDLLRAKGFRWVELQTGGNNIPARGLYKKVGFQEVDWVSPLALRHSPSGG